MNRILFAAVILFFAPYCRAQGMYGAQLGLGYSMGYTSKLTPNFDAFCLHKVIRRVYAGGELSVQRYSMLNDIKTSGAANYGDIISVSEKANYAFLCAKVDYAVGFHQYFHFSLSYGPGIFVGGHQYTNTHLPYWTTPGGASYGADTTAVNTTYNIPNVTFKGSFAISERIPTPGYWNILLSQEFNFLPGNLSNNGPAFNTSYIAFKVGIMHKYPMVFVEY